MNNNNNNEFDFLQSIKFKNAIQSLSGRESNDVKTNPNINYNNKNKSSSSSSHLNQKNGDRKNILDFIDVDDDDDDNNDLYNFMHINKNNDDPKNLEHNMKNIENTHSYLQKKFLDPNDDDDDDEKEHGDNNYKNNNHNKINKTKTSSLNKKSSHLIHNNDNSSLFLKKKSTNNNNNNTNNNNGNNTENNNNNNKIHLPNKSSYPINNRSNIGLINHNLFNNLIRSGGDSNNNNNNIWDNNYENDINEIRERSVIKRSDPMIVIADESDPNWVLSGKTSDIILNDFAAVLREHMEIGDIDDIIKLIEKLRIPIQKRLYYNPLRPYIKGSMKSVRKIYKNRNEIINIKEKKYRDSTKDSTISDLEKDINKSIHLDTENDFFIFIDDVIEEGEGANNDLYINHYLENDKDWSNDNYYGYDDNYNNEYFDQDIEINRITNIHINILSSIKMKTAESITKYSESNFGSYIFLKNLMGNMYIQTMSPLLSIDLRKNIFQFWYAEYDDTIFSNVGRPSFNNAISCQLSSDDDVKKYLESYILFLPDKGKYYYEKEIHDLEDFDLIDERYKEIAKTKLGIIGNITNDKFLIKKRMDFISDLIYIELNNPWNSYNFILSPDILAAFNEAWVLIDLYLKNVWVRNKNSIGFTRYANFFIQPKDEANGCIIPKVDILFLDNLTLDKFHENRIINRDQIDNVFISKEFSGLVSACHSRIIQTSGGAVVGTRFQMSDLFGMIKFFFMTIKDKLSYMGFRYLDIPKQIITGIKPEPGFLKRARIGR